VRALLRLCQCSSPRESLNPSEDAPYDIELEPYEAKNFSAFG